MKELSGILEKNIEDIRENLESFLLRHEHEYINDDVEKAHHYLSALDYLALAKNELRLAAIEAQEVYEKRIKEGIEADTVGY